MPRIPSECEAFIITKTENDIKCYALQSLEMSLSMSADVYAEFLASGQYIDQICDLDFIIKSVAYANELSIHKNLINSINNKRKKFSIPYSSGTINCPDCSKNKGSSLERPYTRDTVFLVCKWYSEGMTVKKIASLLSQSEENIRKALEIGGVFDVTQEGGAKLS